MSNFAQMTPLTIIMNMEGYYSDKGGLPGFKNATWDDIGMCLNVTNQGNHAVSIKLTLEDGTPVLSHTTYRLLWNAVRAFEARYGQPT